MTRRLICLGVLTFALDLLILPLLPIAIAHADAVDDWYAAVCGDNGLVFKRIAYLGLAVIAASGLANFKSLLGVPVLGPVINFVALNWRELLSAASKAAADQGKKAVMLLAVIGASVALSACNLASVTPAQVQADEQKALYFLSAVGCVNAAAVNAASAVAAPIVNATEGPGGTVVLGLVDTAVNAAATASNGGPCTVTVPAAAVVPAAPAAPAS
jgi:hypothetical protein